MSSLRFTKSPHRPNHIAAEVWDKEWIGLDVGLASVFPRTVGHLGDLSETLHRVFEKETGMFRHPTQVDSMNHYTEMLSEPMWISRGSLIHACKYSIPVREVILGWLEEETQKYKEIFAVPDSVAEYLP